VESNGVPQRMSVLRDGRISFTSRRAGLPDGVNGVRIDADGDQGAAMITNTGELYVYNWSRQRWVNTGTYASDVGIGGGYIWIVSAEPLGDGYKIYRAPYRTLQSNFQWEFMYGWGTRIDVGGDGRAWTITSAYQVWEWNGSWQNRNFSGLDISVNQTNRAWVVSTNYVAGYGGGQIYTYNFGGGWEATQGSGHAIATGIGTRVWIANNAEEIYLGTGRL